jgi:hypothetical protein
MQYALIESEPELSSPWTNRLQTLQQCAVCGEAIDGDSSTTRSVIVDGEVNVLCSLWCRMKFDETPLL